MRTLRMRHLNKYLFNKIGLHIQPLEESPTQVGLLKKLASLPIEFHNVFDVGAYKGKWSQEVQKYFPKANFFLFEPNDVHNKEILKLGFKPFNLLLGKKSGEIVKFYGDGRTGDSFFLEKNPTYLGTEKDVELHSLFDIVQANNLPVPDFLKIDTQGSELEILLGAESLLTNVKVILLELPITRMNIGAASLTEIVDFMESRNFVPIHLSGIHLVIDILIQIDIAFLRRDLFIECFGHDDISHRDINPSL